MTKTNKLQGFVRVNGNLIVNLHTVERIDIEPATKNLKLSYTTGAHTWLRANAGGQALNYYLTGRYLDVYTTESESGVVLADEMWEKHLELEEIRQAVAEKKEKRITRYKELTPEAELSLIQNYVRSQLEFTEDDELGEKEWQEYWATCAQSQEGRGKTV